MVGVTDIRIACGFRDHLKRAKLESRLGAAGVLCLLDLWLYCGENKPDGNLAGMTEEDVELAARWRGESGKFFASLVEIKLLDVDASGFRIHDWEDLQSFAVNAWRREDKARYAALIAHGMSKRDARKRVDDARMKANSSREVLLSADSEQRASTATSIPLPSQPNPSVPTLRSKPIPSGAVPTDSAFDVWWLEYPKPLGSQRDDARGLWRGLIETGAATEQQLLDASVNYAESVTGTEPRYILGPVNFLGANGQERWRDYMTGVPGARAEFDPYEDVTTGPGYVRGKKIVDPAWDRLAAGLDPDPRPTPREGE